LLPVVSGCPSQILQHRGRVRGVKHQLLWRINTRWWRSPSNGGAVARGPNPGKDSASLVPMSGQMARSERRGAREDGVILWPGSSRIKGGWTSRWLQCRSRGKEQRERQSGLGALGRRKIGGSGRAWCSRRPVL
jgi:hypothetical protein